MKNRFQVRAASRVAMILALFLALVVTGCGKTPSDPPAAGTTPPPAPAAAEKLKLGWVGGLTGPLAEIVQDSKAGSEQALGEINAKGGVLGRQVELIFADTKTDPQASREAVERLVTSDKVPAMIGDYYSPNVAASASIADQAKVVMFSPGAGQPSLTKQGLRYLFRNVLAQDYSVVTAADYAITKLGVKTFVIFQGVDSFSKSNGESFAAYVKKQGAEVLGVESYDRQTTKDFNNLLLKYKDKNPGGIFLAGSQADGGLIAKQARGLGMTAQFVGSNTMTKLPYGSIGGDAVVGTVASTEWVGDVENYDKFAEPQTIEFVKAWTARTGKAPSFDAAHGYDAVKIIAAAIEKAGSADGTKIAEAIRAMGQYNGVVGTYQFQDNGDVILPSYILKWESATKMIAVSKAPDIKP